MSDTIFLLTLALLLSTYLLWGFRMLPEERWQIAAAVPVARDGSGHWHGVNFTWYGVLTANAYVCAVAMLFILLDSVRIPLSSIAAMTVAVLAVCVPASRLVARIVEKKRQTFTVGGAVFVGYLISPVVIVGVNRLMAPLAVRSADLLATLAAFGISYCFGEGLGRLACISFGCCYGKALADSPARLRRIFAGCCFTFSGKTKKIAYADNLDGTKVLPVQAVTALLYVVTGLCATMLFLHGRHSAAFILATAVTQGWRVLSEIFRADYRGNGRISAYQMMGMFTIPYSWALVFFSDASVAHVPDITAGLGSLWHPAMLLFLQCIWLVIFLYTGRSTVTGASITFHVHQDRI